MPHQPEESRTLPADSVSIRARFDSEIRARPHAPRQRYGGGMSDIASLTREEAAERAALINVERYDVAVDLRGLYEGELWAATSTVSFGCREPGASTFVDCVGDVSSVTLNGEELDPGHGRARPHPAARSAGRQRAGRLAHAVRHPLGHGDPEDGRPARQARLRLVELRARPGALRLRLLRPARPEGPARLRGGRSRDVDGDQQLRTRPGRAARRRRRGRPALDLRRHAQALDVRHGRQRRSVPRDPVTARRVRPRTVQPAVAPAVPGARRRGALRPHRPRPGVLRRALRSAVRPGALRPGLRPEHGRGDGELGLGDLDRQRPVPQPARPTASGLCAPRSSCTRWRTCGSATWSRCCGGTTCGSTRPSRRGRRTGRASTARSSPTSGPPSWPATRWPAIGRTCRRPPTPSGARCPTSRRRWRTSTPSPTARAPACSSS